MKKLLCICFLFVICLSGCTAAGTESEVETTLEQSSEEEVVKENEADVYYLSVASSSDIRFPDEWVCSDGSILKIMKYPYSELGSDRELIQGCQANKISIFVGGNVTQTDLIPELALLDIPYLFDRDKDDMRQISEQLLEWFQPYYEKQGLRLLDWRMSAFNRILLQDSIDSVREFQELKIRIMENSARAEYWTALGAEALTIPFEEIWYYLKNNKINAIDGGFWTLESKDYELLEDYRYLVKVGFISASSVVINQEEYENLPDAVQEAVEVLATEHLQSSPKTQYAELFNSFENQELNNNVEAALKENRQVVVDHLKKALGEEIVQDFLAYIEEIK